MISLPVHRRTRTMRLALYGLTLAAVSELASANGPPPSLDLRELLKMERAVVHTLGEHGRELERGMESIRHYVAQVREMYEREGCDVRGGCEDEEAARDAVLANPIYNYQTLKRLVVHFKDVEDTLAAIDIKGKVVIRCSY